MFNNKRNANKRERKLATDLNMHKTLNSGSVFNDGDMADTQFVVDEKFTVNTKSISVKVADLVKLDRQAMDMIPPRIPVTVININGFKRAILSLDDFIMLRDAYLRRDQ